MKYRKLQIVRAGVYGIACLLVIAMWVRSCYWRCDVINFGKTRIVSVHGCVLVNAQLLHQAADIYTWQTVDGNIVFVSFPADDVFPGKRAATIHYGFLLAATVAVAVGALSSTASFSLRTLLIGMTAVAIGLGWLVYALR